MNRDHTSWCARGHHCAAHLGEHRTRPVTVKVPGAGSLVLTRVQSANGTGHAEVRLNVALATSERDARLQVTALMTHLTRLIGPARAIGGRAA